MILKCIVFFSFIKEIKEAKPEQDSSAQIAADQTQSSTATQATTQKTSSYQPETQTQSSLESQVAQTTIPATQSDSPVAQAEATATQADTTATQADASATQSAAFTTTQAAAAPVTPEVPASQTAAYTNSKWFLHFKKKYWKRLFAMYTCIWNEIILISCFLI